MRGRLWVICTTCARWNLSPLDERWEVIESCERLYRDTKKRMNTGQVGLAKLPDQTTLVRIGDPVFPEYASWRYGRLFTRRDQMSAYSAPAGAAAVLTTLLLMGGPLAALSGAGATALGTYHLGRLSIRYLTGLRHLGPVTLGDGSIQLLNVARARQARIVTTHDGRWTLAIPGYGGSILRPTVAVDVGDEEHERIENFDLITPESAETSARRIMPAVNAAGGDDDTVGGAAKLYEQWEGRIGETVGKLVDFMGRPLPLAEEPHLSLAFEMSVYEDQERRWLLSELFLLKAVWHEAEKLAAISDALTIPVWLEEQVAKLKARADTER
jgi:hypothetical protein